jgi:hypothetical protein
MQIKGKACGENSQDASSNTHAVFITWCDNRNQQIASPGLLYEIWEESIY